MQIHANAGGLAETNCYLLVDEASQTAALIDAPKETVAPLLALCREKKIALTHLILTHGHWDHLSDHDVVTAEFPNAKVLIHKLEEPKLQRPGSLLWELPYSIAPRDADGYIAEGDVLEIGSLKLRVMHTPGHAVGHCCLFLAESVPPVLFAGDLLMAGSVGRYDLPGDGDLRVLIKSLARVVELPKETVVLSGHGPETTIGNEINGNPFLHEYGLA